MGEPILILALVVIVTGGIGSIRGAFVAAIVGMVDTVGRAFLPACCASSSSRSGVDRGARAVARC